MKKILIIERGEVAEVMTMILSAEGYEVEAIGSATQTDAVAIRKPDLVIVHQRNNNTLPGQDYIRLLKADPNTKKIPVILDATDPDIRMMAQTSGADAYLAKPFDINYLVELVGSMLGKDYTKAS